MRATSVNVTAVIRVCALGFLEVLNAVRLSCALVRPFRYPHSTCWNPLNLIKLAPTAIMKEKVAAERQMNLFQHIPLNSSVIENMNRGTLR